MRYGADGSLQDGPEPSGPPESAVPLPYWPGALKRRDALAPIPYRILAAFLTSFAGNRHARREIFDIGQVAPIPAREIPVFLETSQRHLDFSPRTQPQSILELAFRLCIII